MTPDALPPFFARLLRDAFASEVSGSYLPFREIARATLQVIAADHGAIVSASGTDNVLSGFATFGAADRAEKQPMIPILASTAAAPAAATSAGYLFYEMPVGEKGWCPYCMVDALHAHGRVRIHSLGIEESDFTVARPVRRQAMGEVAPATEAFAGAADKLS